MTKKQYRLRCQKRYCQRERRSKRLQQSYDDRIKYSEHRIFMRRAAMIRRDLSLGFYDPIGCIYFNMSNSMIKRLEATVSMARFYESKLRDALSTLN